MVLPLLVRRVVGQRAVPGAVGQHLDHLLAAIQIGRMSLYVGTGPTAGFAVKLIDRDPVWSNFCG